MAMLRGYIFCISTEHTIISINFAMRKFISFPMSNIKYPVHAAALRPLNSHIIQSCDTQSQH